MLGGGVQEVPSLGVTGPRLDRQKWHCQKISVIITHFNYSTFIGDALLSLLDQTHENWECVIVDDCSAPEERERLKQVVDAIGSPKIKVLWLPENVGQLSAFFAGFDETDGHFVCLLDPDDRYAETFLEEAVSAHLNKTIVCPIVCTDQYSLVDGQVLTAVYVKHGINQYGTAGRGLRLAPDETRLLFIPAQHVGWHWSSCSSFMFRRAAVNYVRPHRTFPYEICADTYLAYGAHALGGSLFLTKPLVYRVLHDVNSFTSKDFYSTFQEKRREGVTNWTPQIQADVFEALQHNKAPIQAPPIPSVKPVSPSTSKHQRVIAKWKRSFAKRTRRVWR